MRENPLVFDNYEESFLRGFLVVYLVVLDKKVTMVCSLVHSQGYLFLVSLVDHLLSRDL